MHSDKATAVMAASGAFETGRIFVIMVKHLNVVFILEGLKKECAYILRPHCFIKKQFRHSSTSQLNWLCSIFFVNDTTLTTSYVALRVMIDFEEKWLLSQLEF